MRVYKRTTRVRVRVGPITFTSKVDKALSRSTRLHSVLHKVFVWFVGADFGPRNATKTQWNVVGFVAQEEFRRRN